MRIDKHLAHQGLGTRSEVRALLKAGRIMVEGTPVHDAGYAVDPSADEILFDGQPVAYQASLHLMLHKPAGYVTAAEDARHATVMELLPPQATAMRCMPVGRLDLDTEGLLLLTTDGPLAHRLLSPKRHVDKTYFTIVDAPLGDADINAFAQGIPLSDFTASPAQLAILEDPHQAHVTIQEGKYHQVKRMFGARGKTVTYLKRIAFGPLSLDPALELGAYRALTADELTQLTLASKGNGHG